MYIKQLMFEIGVQVPFRLQPGVGPNSLNRPLELFSLLRHRLPVKPLMLLRSLQLLHYYWLTGRATCGCCRWKCLNLKTKRLKSTTRAVSTLETSSTCRTTHGSAVSRGRPSARAERTVIAGCDPNVTQEPSVRTRRPCDFHAVAA